MCIVSAWSFVYHKIWKIQYVSVIGFATQTSILIVLLSSYLHAAILINPRGARVTVVFGPKFVFALAACYVLHTLKLR